MGKIDKSSKRKAAGKALRHDPLEKQITNDLFVNEEDEKKRKQTKDKNKLIKNKKKNEEEDFITPSISKKILKLAKKQEIELDEDDRKEFNKSLLQQNKRNKQQSNKKQQSNEMMEDEDEEDDGDFNPKEGELDEDDDDINDYIDEEEDDANINQLVSKIKNDNNINNDFEIEEYEEEEGEEEFYDNQQEKINYENDYKEIQSLDDDDESAVNAFSSTYQSRSLSDIILQKIKEKESENLGSEIGSAIVSKKLPPKVVKVYRGVGELLRQYSTGKIPKAFKMLPRLSNWEEVLYLTKPDLWTPPAVAQATRLFAANMNDKLSQRFYNIVLLPRVREDIHKNKKLNFHLYQALRKACFKPGGFFKGIVIPLCQSGTCTYLEAHVIGSIISKQSLPVLHSAAALLKISTLEYSGSNSMIIKTFLDKRYALPYKVIDALVIHFTKFMDYKEKLPVVWHKSLLTFVARYKTDLTKKQKESIFNLCKKQFHDKITPEVRREMENSPSREDKEKNRTDSMQQ